MPLLGHFWSIPVLFPPSCFPPPVLKPNSQSCLQSGLRTGKGKQCLQHITSPSCFPPPVLKPNSQSCLTTGGRKQEINQYLQYIAYFLVRVSGRSGARPQAGQAGTEGTHGVVGPFRPTTCADQVPRTGRKPPFLL